jgi:hypothetical protein
MFILLPNKDLILEIAASITAGVAGVTDIFSVKPDTLNASCFEV